MMNLEGTTRTILWPAHLATGARDIAATNREGPYISEIRALNINGNEPGGDWHASAWFRRDKMWRDPIPLYEGRTLRVLRDTGLYDARRALRGQGHPQGWQLRPVWAANYPRACIDLAAGGIEQSARSARENSCAGIDPSADDLAGWLMTRDAARTALAMAQAMAAADDEYGKLWARWATRRRGELERLWETTL